MKTTLRSNITLRNKSTEDFGYFTSYSLGLTINAINKKYSDSSESIVNLNPNNLLLTPLQLENGSFKEFLNKNNYYLGIKTLYHNNTIEPKINLPSSGTTGETDYSEVYTYGRTSYVNKTYKAEKYITFTAIDDNSNYISIDLLNLYSDSAKITSGSTTEYQGILNLDNNPYYNTLSNEEKAVFKTNLTNIYSSWGEELRNTDEKEAPCLWLNIYIKNNDAYSKIALSGLPVLWAATSQQAKLSIGKYDITAAVDAGRLKYTSTGLDLLTTNNDSGIRIYKNGYDEENRVFYADNAGNLILKGKIYASDGEFTGIVHASSGEFTGKVTASSGKIGSLTITSDGLYIGDSDLIIGSNGITTKTNNLTINTDGSIIAKNISLGESATISDYLKIGDNCYIYNPEENLDKTFIKILDSTLANDVIEIKSDATGNIGNIQFNGNTSVIKSSTDFEEGATYGWELTPTTATFNNIVANGKITTAIFETEKTLLSGSTFIFKSGAELEEFEIKQIDSNVSIYYKNNEKYIITVNSASVGVNNKIKYAGKYPNGQYNIYNSSDNIVKSNIDIELYKIATYSIQDNLYYINLGNEFLEIVETDTIAYINSLSVADYEFKPITKFGDTFLDNHLYYFTDYSRSGCFFATYIEEDESFKCTEEISVPGKFNLAVDFGRLVESKIEDWIIGINSSANKISGLGRNSISLNEVSLKGSGGYELIPKIILGEIPEGVFNNSESTYGLYAKSAYLTGSLVSEYIEGGTKKYTGLNTLSDVPFNDTFVTTDKDTSPIVFWAGANSTSDSDIQNATFLITSNGTLYANRGYFNGSILTKADILADALKVNTVYGRTVGSDTIGLDILQASVGIIYKNNDDELIFKVSEESMLLNTPIRFVDGEDSRINGLHLILTKTDHKLITVRNTTTYDSSGQGTAGEGTIVITPKRLNFFNSYLPDTAILVDNYNPIGDFSIYPVLNSGVKELRVNCDNTNLINLNVDASLFTNKVLIKEELTLGNFSSATADYILSTKEGQEGIDIYIYE